MHEIQLSKFISVNNIPSIISAEYRSVINTTKIYRGLKYRLSDYGGIEPYIESRERSFAFEKGNREERPFPSHATVRREWAIGIARRILTLLCRRVGTLPAGVDEEQR